MNLNDSVYNSFALVREMMQTTDVIRDFSHQEVKRFAAEITENNKLFLTGEGSSRIFPAKRMIYDLLRKGVDISCFTEGATQALEYDLSGFSVFGASNSGQTKEVIRLFKKLKEQGHDKCFGLTANKSTMLQEISNDTHILKCGKEDAVAATKSVIEQALFYDSLLHHLRKENLEGLNDLAEKVEEALTLKIDKSITEIISKAGTVYFAGRNNGVAEELTLKTNEITRKRSEFLEGTYGVHGIEEVMESGEVVIWISPFPQEIEKFYECLVKGVGLNIIAVSDMDTPFPTIRIPDAPAYREYIELAAGWNILVETGINLGIDLDKPERARKVGNEFTG